MRRLIQKPFLVLRKGLHEARCFHRFASNAIIACPIMLSYFLLFGPFECSKSGDTQRRAMPCLVDGCELGTPSMRQESMNHLRHF